MTDPLTYLRELKSAIEDLPDKKRIESIAEQVSNQILSKVERYK